MKNEKSIDSAKNDKILKIISEGLGKYDWCPSFGGGQHILTLHLGISQEDISLIMDFLVKSINNEKY